ncbi:MAG: type VII secretion integral membrane protein EccD [Mycobacterium sp.]|nr:type VII secretion integral membrane protein EccD [Mycobacterium sp.]
MPESVRRLSVQTDGERTCEITDLVLPAGASVDSLLPDIVTLARPELSPDSLEWRLERASGRPINGSLSLVQNDVHDGDVLWLRTVAAPALGPVRQHTVKIAAGPPMPDRVADVIPLVLGLWMLAVAGAMLAWSGTHGDRPTAGAISLGSALFTLAAALRAGRPASTSWGVAAIGLAGVAGFSAVPIRPSAPNFLLASAAVLAVALILMRTGEHLLSAAAAALSMPMVVAAGLASCGPMAMGIGGPAIAVTALAMLSAAPRCAVAVAGLTTDLETLDEGESQRIDLAHRALTGMVIGAAAAAAIGACVVAVGAVRHGGTATLVFSWALAAAMLLRAPSYRLPARRRSALASGMICTTAALAVTAMGFPGQVSWLGLAVVTVGLAALRIGPPSATAVRRLAYVEHVALAAVLPAALWAADVYALVRGR